MKLETYLSKFYDVEVDTKQTFPGSTSTETRIWLNEKTGDSGEPIGCLFTISGCETYQWRNIYGALDTGVAFLGDAAVKAAAKAGRFNPRA